MAINSMKADIIRQQYRRKRCGRGIMGNTYGYVRCSTKEQNEDRQLIAMREAGVVEKHGFVDKQSGKDFNRPQYQRLLHIVKPDDLIYIKSIDRLGRNYTEILEQWKVLTKEKQADLCVLDMSILDTRREKNLLGTFISDLVLTLLSYVAANERLNIRQCQAEGIAAAKARGVRFGPLPKPLPENFCEVRKRWRRKEISVTQAAGECGMAVSTFYERARRFESDPKFGAEVSQTIIE